jgi:hypothetical protein
MTYAEFISYFPEFLDPVKYPRNRVQFWLTYAEQLVSTDRWGTLYLHGISLLTAHSLVIDGLHGVMEGIDTSQSADSVSWTAELKSFLQAKAGLYNKTTYGIQYWQLAQLIGAGPLYFAN